MIKLSIIIPIYNMEKYLKECLNNIPVREDLEIIMVNDGSKDTSEKICKKYIKDNWVYIYKENDGFINARKTGIEVAKGANVLFLDPDDFISEVGLNRITELLYKSKFVTWETQTIDEDSLKIKDYYPSVNNDSNFLLFATNRFAPWLRTFPMEMIKKNINNIDELYLAAHEFEMLKKFSHIPEKIHHYRIREDSLTRTKKYTGMPKDWKETFERHLSSLKTVEAKTWYLHYTKYYDLLFLLRDPKELKYFRKIYKKQIDKELSKQISKNQLFKFKVFNWLWKSPFYKIIILFI